MKSRLLKTSTLKKAICLILVAVTLCLTLSSCKEKTEEKKLLGTECTEGGYAFSYDEGWRVSFTDADTVLTTVTVGGQLPDAVVRFTVFENKSYDSAKDYWEAGAEGFSSVYDDFKVVSRESFAPSQSAVFSDGYIARMSMSTSDAMGLSGQASNAEQRVPYNLTQLVFNGDGRICCATYISTTAKNADYDSVIDSVKNTFKFTEAKRSEVSDKGYSDFKVNAPDGWTLTESEAYLVFKKGNATVVANAFSLNYSKASVLYWNEDYKPTLEKGLDGFTVVSLEEKAKLGPLSAVDCVYTGKSASGTEYKFRTFLAVSVSEVYLLTLTASHEDYENCVADFLKMAEGFTVK